MPRRFPDTYLAAIDVGTNSVKLEIARPMPDGGLERVHQERDPIRPGEGLYETGVMRDDVARRLMSALRRYGALCRRYGARVRAVATSAVREAKNRDDIVARVKREAGIDLEVISGREEARLICLGVLNGKPDNARTLCLDIGGGSTEVATAVGEKPVDLWSVALGAVRLAELFVPSGRISSKDVALMRNYASEAVREVLPEFILGAPRRALGSSGSIRNIVAFAAAEGTGHVTTRRISDAIDQLIEMGTEGRRRRFESNRADIIIPGAIILEALSKHLRLESIIAVDRGLRDGVLIELLRRHNRLPNDRLLLTAATDFGRRCHYDEHHARHVAKLALRLFDELQSHHKLPAQARLYLEVAAILHDVGNLVSYHRHHRHSYYLISNVDFPGISERERELIARIARFHRRSPPDPQHPALTDLSRSEVHLVRKLAILLRMADSLDRSHQQPVKDLRVSIRGGQVDFRLITRGPTDLEIWDAAHEFDSFRSVFKLRVTLTVAPAQSPRRLRKRQK